MELMPRVEPHPYTYEDLIDFLLGKMEPERTVLTGRHLADCTYCAGTVARYSKIRALLRRDFSIDPPSRVIKRAKAIAAYPPADPQFQFQFPRISMNLRSSRIAFAGGFALALVGLLILNIFAGQDNAEANDVFPVVINVQGLELVASTVGRFFGTKPPAATAFTPLKSTSIEAESPSIVISQIYGGGGNRGAALTHDFVELYNVGETPVSLAGWSLQYASAAGNTNFGATPSYLTEIGDITLMPGQYLLIQEARGKGGSALLPGPDLIDPTPIELSATSGKLALVNTATPLGCNGSTNPCSQTSLASIIDLVGYGKADFYSGDAPTLEATNTSSVLRLGNGCMNTRNNTADFVVSIPSPRNSAHVRSICPRAKVKP